METKLFIDGTWCDARRGGTLDVINPANERVFHQVAAGTAEDIDHAVEAAKTAMKGPWGRTTGKERAVFLRAIAKEIEEDKQQLAEIEVRDNGKPLAEAIADIGDSAYCFNLYARYAEELDGRQGQTIAVPDARFETRISYMPAGVAGLIVPWNYPLLMAAWKVAPAIAAGCASVLKPSEYTPLTALELARICQRRRTAQGRAQCRHGPRGGRGRSAREASRREKACLYRVRADRHRGRRGCRP